MLCAIPTHQSFKADDRVVVRIGDRLTTHAETLAEVLQNRGHNTHGVISHVLLNRNYGFAQGFDSYDQSPYEKAGDDVHAAITSQHVTDSAIEWLSRAPKEEPFFLFTHYFDPHCVYQHHPEFEQGSSDYDGPVKPGMSIWDLRDMRAELDAADLDYLRALYHEEIAYTDQHIGRLLAALEERGERLRRRRRLGRAAGALHRGRVLFVLGVLGVLGCSAALFEARSTRRKTRSCRGHTKGELYSTPGESSIPRGQRSSTKYRARRCRGHSVAVTPGELYSTRSTQHAGSRTPF